MPYFTWKVESVLNILLMIVDKKAKFKGRFGFTIKSLHYSKFQMLF